jgi:hypothetical protein
MATIVHEHVTAASAAASLLTMDDVKDVSANTVR